MPEEGCDSLRFSANEDDFPGTPLQLDVWLPLSLVNIASAVVTLYDQDVIVLGITGGGAIDTTGGGSGELIPVTKP